MTVPTVTPVRFEHHRDAFGIGESTPRVSFIVANAPEGWTQAGYELQRRGGETVDVGSPESVLVDWPFAPLTSRERCEVRVRVRGADGTMSEWSDWAAVETGLLDPADWSARLIRPADAGDGAALLRTSFDVDAADIVRARVYATAQGVYELELNGIRVGDQELAPGWTAYESRLRYQTYDVTGLVISGQNVLGGWLADGWWRGHLGWDGRRALYGDELGLYAQLEIDYADGSRQTVVTGQGWRSAAAPILSADLYDGETFDARLLDHGWSTTRFDAESWARVQVADLDTAVLVAPDGPPVRHVETLPVQDVLTSPSGKTILDFGQNVVGRLRIRVTGDAGTTIALRHAEVLEHGELATAPLRGAKATDRYTLRGEGIEEWAPRFTFHGFRYAEIDGWPDGFEADAVVAEVLHTDMERTGWFDSSDPLLNRLHENVVWGMRGNFVDVPTDCPQRDERLGWTGDLQVFAPTAEFLYDSAGMLQSWLKDLAAEQRALGGTPMVVPAVVTGYTGPTAGWADAATVVPWTLYQAYGDEQILRDQYASMAAWIEEVAAAASENLLWDKGFQFGDWLDPTAPADNPAGAKTYPEIVATAYFARSSRIVADTARILGHDDDAARYTSLADRVRQAFLTEYVSPAGRLLSDSPTAYALALQFDLIPDPAMRQRAADRLAELVRSGGYKIPTGFLGTPVITDALSAHGHADVAYRLLMQTEAPSWLYAVRHGATTIWERWDSLLPDGTVNPSGMTSFNHYAFGAVADWMHRVVAGLAPAAPGYRRLRIAPLPPRRGLRSASATLRTPYGEASASWTLEDGDVRVGVVVPVGVTAEIVLPSGASSTVGAGSHSRSEPFEVESDELVEVTVDTPLGTLMEVEAASEVLKRVIVKYVPGAEAQVSAGLNGQEGVTPRQIAAMLPGGDAVLDDLQRGFAAVSAGEPLPDDLFAAADADDPDEIDGALHEAAGLLTGASFWTTKGADGIRPLTLVDGPHGVRLQKDGDDHLGLHASEPATCFPPGSGIASSWDPDLVREVGAAIGREARHYGVDVVLGPGVNIKRSPLGGRNFEYLSEDPTLAGTLATGWVQGLQSTGVGASLKHFAVNNQETDRMQVSAELDERTLREIYVPAFERVVREADPATVMSAYNAINGEFCSENRWLLTDLLRDEWGFGGLVVSDWGAVKDRVEALRAGLDLEMPGSGEDGTRSIVDAVRDGRLSESFVSDSVARLSRLAERTRPRGDAPELDADEHHALARRAAAQSVVLLRNEERTLPLLRDQRVAVIGELAVDPQFQGGGSSHVNPTRVDLPLSELRTALGETNVGYAAGYTRDGGQDPDALIAEASALAADADVAVVFAGLYEADQSEGFDRSDLDLPAAHVRVIQEVAAVARRTVVVLMNGGVVCLEPWHDSVDAIVEGFALGQAVGGALADVLTGTVNPSGHLAETIPLRLEDTPSFLTFPGENRVTRHGEGVFVGYRHYTTVGRAVRYPFGHGLSYTTFEHGPVEAEANGADAVVARVSVRNTGAVAGGDVVQVYVAPADAPVRRPVRELAAFRKVVLEPGESTTVEFTLDRRAFAYWDVAKHRWRVQGGTYVIQVGRSATDFAAAAAIVLDGDVERPEPLTLESPVGEWFGHPVVGPALMQAMSAGATPEQMSAAEENADMLKMVESMPMGQFARFPGVEIPEEVLEQLIDLSVSGSAGDM